MDGNERLEAMLLALRDQLDALGERLETQLAMQARALHRVEAALVELEYELRGGSLGEVPERAPGGGAPLRT